MSNGIKMKGWTPLDETRVKLTYKDGKDVLVKRSDFNRAFGAIISADKDDVIRDFAIKE